MSDEAMIFVASVDARREVIKGWIFPLLLSPGMKVVVPMITAAIPHPTWHY
jgi:hypothetical protein